MQEQFIEIFSYIRGAVKYKFVGLTVAWVVCMATWLVVMALPDKYTSEAKIHVETRTMLKPLLRGMTVQTDVAAVLRVMKLLMFTSSNMEQVINLSDLKQKIRSPSDLYAVIDNLKKDIQITGGGADEIFSIKYEAGSPVEAKNVVQAVLTVFSEQTQQSTLAGADVASHFIDEQIREYEARLRNAEKAKENFKRANLGLLPGEGADHIGQIQRIKTDLEATKLQLHEGMSRREALKKQLDEATLSDEDWGLIADNEHMQTEEDAKIAELKKKRDDLLIKYTQNHPEVVYIQKLIAKVEAVNAEKKSKIPSQSIIESAVKSNPYLQTIKVELNTVDANIAAMRWRATAFEEQIQKLESELNSRLSVETELKNLTRDYETIKTNYEQLLTSREQANLSKKVDDKTDSLKFKIADPPSLPLKPSSPNRALLFSVCLVLGVGLGTATSVLIYMLRPAVMSLTQLKEITGLPVLGVVSLNTNPAKTQKNQKGLLLFGAGFFGLVGVYGAFMAVALLGLKPSSLTLFL